MAKQTLKQIQEELHELFEVPEMARTADWEWEKRRLYALEDRALKKQALVARVKGTGRFLLFFLAFAVAACLGACGTKQTPQSTQFVYNITDNRQITQIIGDGNTTTARAAPRTEQRAEPKSEQTTENTTKSGIWIVRLVLIGLALVAGFIYFRFLKQKVKLS
jgi:hypothetical protein